MLMPYKLGLGGPLGNGNQYMPWIHILDMVRAIMYLLNTPHAHGAFNMCAPHPVTNRIFSVTLAKTLKRPHILFTPKWVMDTAMGESSCLLFDSIRAKPKNSRNWTSSLLTQELSLHLSTCFMIEAVE